MNSTYSQKTINCPSEDCNEMVGKIIAKPEKIELFLHCDKGHKFILEVDKKTNEITILEEES